MKTQVKLILLLLMSPYTLGARNAPPMNVSIRTDNNDNFEAGFPRVLACVVFGSVPSPKVTWYLGNTMLRPNVYKEVNRGNYTVSSLTFVPSLADNGKDLVCRVTNHMTETVEDRVTVSVGHRPICIESGFKTIGAVEGDSETLVCQVESYPDPEQFIWTFADGRTIYTSSKKVFGHENRYSSTLIWVPREDDFGPLYCRASNRFGEQKQPCTFSIITGGPPTTPECDIFWEDKEILRICCEKNWEGGRPQTINLEIKGPDGIRKMSTKGHELTVNSLRQGTNFTIELYATNSRGRSLTIQLALPRSTGTVYETTEHHYETNEVNVWNVIYFASSVTIVVIIILCLCISTFRIGCYSSEDVTEGQFRRDEEIAEMTLYGLTEEDEYEEESSKEAGPPPPAPVRTSSTVVYCPSSVPRVCASPQKATQPMDGETRKQYFI